MAASTFMSRQQGTGRCNRPERPSSAGLRAVEKGTSFRRFAALAHFFPPRLAISHCLGLAACILAFSPAGQAQAPAQGEVANSSGTAKRLRLKDAPQTAPPRESCAPKNLPWRSIERQDLVGFSDKLCTESDSSLEVRFDQTGRRLILGAQAQVAFSDTGMIIIEWGALRAMRQGRAGTSLVEVEGFSGKASTSGSGFIACCGTAQNCPAMSGLIQRTPQLNSQVCSSACFFVAVYGSTEVQSLDASLGKVDLSPGLASVVCQGRPPSPPLPLPESDFLDLIDSTTIVGTGARRDQLGMTDKALRKAGAELPSASSGDDLAELQLETVDQPLLPMSLPEPPPPPRPPLDQR